MGNIVQESESSSFGAFHGNRVFGTTTSGLVITGTVTLASGASLSVTSGTLISPVISGASLANTNLEGVISAGVGAVSGVTPGLSGAQFLRISISGATAKIPFIAGA